jgi:hypothetical protein
MRQWLVFLSLFLLLGTPLHTAAQTAAPPPVSGQVTDPSGAPIAGASITIASNGQPVGAPAATDARGGFQLTLPPGKYSLTVAADGFREVTRTIGVPVSAPHQLDFALALAGVRETVAVTAAPPEAVSIIRSATKTTTPLLNVPQSVAMILTDQSQEAQ